MQQIDRSDNTEFKYFYCHKFKWLNPLDNEIRAGHPKEKTIYRGWYNTETKSYKLITNPGNAIFLESLKEDDGNFLFGFTCDFEEVTKSNILKFKDITEDNLQDMIQWLEINNMDLKERLGFTQREQPIPIVAIINSMNNEAHQEQVHYQNAFQGFMESGEELLNLNPVAFEKIWTLIDKVLDDIYKIEDTPIDGDYLRHGPTGLSININEAYKCLHKYAGKDRRTNENPDDLYEAMAHILTELIRRDYNNLDQ
jgi:hypothetical protein